MLKCPLRNFQHNLTYWELLNWSGSPSWFQSNTGPVITLTLPNVWVHFSTSLCRVFHMPVIEVFRFNTTKGLFDSLTFSQSFRKRVFA